MEIYDALVIGGGPAGLSAAIYLARFRIKTLIIDAEAGRSMTPGVYHNIPGFLKPVGRQELRKLAAAQAALYGAEKVCDEVIDIKNIENNIFMVVTPKSVYYSKYVIFCTGISDIWPDVEGVENFIGITLHSCPVCAGYECIDKKIAVVSTGEKASGFIMFMLAYTNKLAILTDGKQANVEEKYLNYFTKSGIPIYSGKITQLIGENSKIQKVKFDDDFEIDVDILYSELGIKVNSDLAKKIGVKTCEKGCIIVDSHQKTNIKNVLAAGDVTFFDSKQVVTSMYEGFNTANTIHNELLNQEKAKIQEEIC